MDEFPSLRDGSECCAMEMLYQKISALVKEEAATTRATIQQGLTRIAEQQAKLLNHQPPNSNEGLMVPISLPLEAPTPVVDLDGGISPSFERATSDSISASESSDGSSSFDHAATKPNLHRGKTHGADFSFDDAEEEQTENDMAGKVGSVALQEFILDKEHSWFKQIVFKYCGFIIEWWLDLSEPERTGSVARFVSGNLFESCCVVAIISNAVLMILATNYETQHIGDPAPMELKLWDDCLLVFYIVELLLKLYVHRGFFFCNEDMGWNLFDFVLILISVVDFVGSMLFNMTFLRSVRLLKVAKVLRVFRLMRFLTELRLILKCLVGSMASLCWSIVMMLLIFFMFGTCFVQGCTNYMDESILGYDDPVAQDMRRHFGSVEGAIFTLFAIATGSDWTTYYRALFPAGNVYRGLFLFFIAYVYIAFLNILTGLFVESAMKNALPDNEFLAFEVRKEKLELAQDFKKICEQFEMDDDGNIHRATFVKLIENEEVKAHLEVLGVHVEHATLFFNILEQASHHHHVSVDDLVQGCLKMRGLASSLDMQRVLYEGKVWHKHHKHEIHDLHNKVNKIADCLERLTGPALKAQKQRLEQKPSPELCAI